MVQGSLEHDVSAGRTRRHPTRPPGLESGVLANPRYTVDSAKTTQRSIRTIRLNDEEIAKLLDQLDEGGAVTKERRLARYPYRVKALVVHMQQPGSSIVVPYLVATRNISEGGLAFLHGGFVHPGTRCMAQLITTYGTWDDMPGEVIDCRYQQGNVHEVVMKFEREVDPSVYSAKAIHSRVLLAEDDPATARLAIFHLKQLNADVDHVENGQLAVDKAGEQAYDLILMDMEMPVLDGFGAARTLRDRGYSGTIVAATALTQPEDQQRCIEAGCDRYIPKPYQRDQLSELLVSIRAEPLFSSFYNDPSMVDIINDFVEELSSKVRTLEEAVANGDLTGAQKLLRTLKGEGSGYGFDVITDAAAEAESILLGGSSLADATDSIQALTQLCMQARASGKTNTSNP